MGRQLSILSTLALVALLAACGSGGGEEPSPFAQCSDGLDNDGDGFVDMNDPGCLQPDSNSEAPFNMALSYAIGTAQLEFENSWARPIGQIIVLDGVWAVEKNLPLKGNPDLHFSSFRGFGQNKEPLLPGQYLRANMPFWSEYVTIIIRFADDSGELSPWTPPQEGESLEGDSDTLVASVPVYFIPNVFPGFREFSYASFVGGDPFKG